VTKDSIHTKQDHFSAQFHLFILTNSTPSKLVQSTPSKESLSRRDPQIVTRTVIAVPCHLGTRLFHFVALTRCCKVKQALSRGAVWHGWHISYHCPEADLSESGRFTSHRTDFDKSACTAAAPKGAHHLDLQTPPDKKTKRTTIIHHEQLICCHFRAMRLFLTTDSFCGIEPCCDSIVGGKVRRVTDNREESESAFSFSETMRCPQTLFGWWHRAMARSFEKS
jgi:hypothetical protein